MTDKTTRAQQQKADASAFEAYRILYYPLIGKGGMLESVPEGKDISPSKDGYAKALTVQANLVESTSYALTDSGVAALACLYSMLEEIGSDLIVDPFEDIAAFSPLATRGEPMYPDFPKQVLDISEEEFRAHQAMHYASTYGLEEFAALLGLDITVERGWLPDVKSTEKTEEDEDLLADHIKLDVAISTGYMAQKVSRDLSAPRRMPSPAIDLFVSMLADGIVEGIPKIAFHENMMEAVRFASHRSSKELQEMLSATAQHPGDALKAVMWVCKKDGAHNLATKQKKGFCRFLDGFDARIIAQNMADLSRSGLEAASKLSVARFTDKESSLRKACALVESGEVKSFYAQCEEAWRAYGSGEAGSAELLACYKRRPGVMLRTVSRMLLNGIDSKEILDALAETVDDLSLATLVQLATSTGAIKPLKLRNWAGCVVNEEDVERRERLSAEHRKVFSIATELMKMKLAGIDTPLRGKKIFVDAGGFSLGGSLILPNEIGNASGAYPPAGMAYELPRDKTVRFFVFWNDSSKRVDVDLHFNYTDTHGKEYSLGWNSLFRHDGALVFSGDITHSQNAVEFLDIDMEKSRKLDIDNVFFTQDLYCGANNWYDIEKCYSGAMLVEKKGEAVKLYNGKNIMFHDDLTGAGTNMDYAMVSVQGGYVRILRGAKMPFTDSMLSLGRYIEMLLEAQGAVAADDAENADIVLTVGRVAEGEGADSGTVSLVDNGFFIS